MPDGTAERPTVYTIPIHRSFADSLVAGIMARFGRDPLELASGRILLPNNRAVRAVMDAFVRASSGGLLLPRLIPIGDPELDDRIGGALDPIDQGDAAPRAIDPLERLLTLASIVGRDGESSSEALRLAADLARALDALLIEEVAPTELRRAAGETDELARHW
ncbi:MAG TPA: double-strand break repair protein AddB, partial [Sphingomicrobium sp.]